MIDKNNRHRARYIFLMFLILFTLLGLRFYLNFSKLPPFKEGDKIRITTKVSSEPVRYEKQQYLKLKGLKIYLPLYPEINYGDQIVVVGEVGEGKLVNPKLVKIEVSTNFVYKLRSKLLEIYSVSLSQPHSALVAGVTIGSKSDIPKDFWEQLKQSGTVHVVVASGMNVTLVAGFLMYSLVPLFNRRKAIIIALLGIWIYSIISGFDAPIIRAAIMGSIAFLAVELGRLNTAWRALFLSAFVMLLFKPEWVGDLGFWLSFTATSSLIFFEKKIANLIHKVPVIKNLGVFRDGLITTLAAQIGVAPILIVFFGRFNLLSPITNAAVLWTIPFITILGMIGGLVGLIFVPLGTAVLWLSYPLTLWFVSVVNFMS